MKHRAIIAILALGIPISAGAQSGVAYRAWCKHDEHERITAGDAWISGTCKTSSQCSKIAKDHSDPAGGHFTGYSSVDADSGEWTRELWKPNAAQGSGGPGKPFSPRTGGAGGTPQSEQLSASKTASLPGFDAAGLQFRKLQIENIFQREWQKLIESGRRPTRDEQQSAREFGKRIEDYMMYELRREITTAYDKGVTLQELRQEREFERLQEAEAARLLREEDIRKAVEIIDRSGAGVQRNGSGSRSGALPGSEGFAGLPGSAGNPPAKARPCAPSTPRGQCTPPQ